MPSNISTYAPGAFGDISPRTAAFVVRDLLKRAMPFLVFEKFGQAKPIPKNSTQTIKFRRYFLKTAFASGYNPAEYLKSANFDPTAHQLVEGVTPDGSFLSSEDISASIIQYGDKVTITDRIMDTHEDNILREAVDLLGEQAALVLEKARFQKLLTGTNVFRTSSAGLTVATRDLVGGTITLALQRQIVRSLKRNLARPITTTMKSTPAWGTEAIAPAFVCVCHPDLEPTIRDMPGFVPAEKYGSMPAWETELGKVEDVRYLTSTVVEAWADAGAAVASGAPGAITTTGTKADVYPAFYMGKDAYGLTPLKGGDSITPIVVNPKPSDSDVLGQRGHVGWKAYSGAVILNPSWFVRAEVVAKN